MGWAILAGLVEFVASLAIVLGFQTRLAAALLCLFTLIATYLGHPFWTMADAAARQMNYIHFWKDLAIAGGLLFLFVRGAGPISIDRD
jgi:putative oxidoreductase